MNDAVNTLLGYLPDRFLGIVSAVSAGCAIIVAIFPAPIEPVTWYGKAWDKVWHVIDFVAINVGHGKTVAAAVKAGTVVPVADIVPPAVIVPPTAGAPPL